MVGKAQPRVEWRQPDQSDMNTNKRTLVNIVCTVIDFDIVDLMFYCFDNPFCSGNACPGTKNLIGNIQLFGLVRRLLGELALLGLILPLEV